MKRRLTLTLPVNDAEVAEQLAEHLSGPLGNAPAAAAGTDADGGAIVTICLHYDEGAVAKRVMDAAMNFCQGVYAERRREKVLG